MKYHIEAEALRKAAWPKCDQLAAALASLGISALPALQYASKSPVHHVRSACLRAINSIDADVAKSMAEVMLADRAYEVRETAAQILAIRLPDQP